MAGKKKPPKSPKAKAEKMGSLARRFTMADEVAILVRAGCGVSGLEIRFAEGSGHLGDPRPFRLVGSLWPVLQALDEAIRLTAEERSTPRRSRQPAAPKAVKGKVKKMGPLAGAVDW